MTNKTSTKTRDQRDQAQPAAGGGMPGQGAGRREKAGGSGVYPASSGSWPDDAVTRTEGEWGRGGDDAGTSEIVPDMALGGDLGNGNRLLEAGQTVGTMTRRADQAQKIMPCLWFDNQVEDAVNFYVSVFPNSKILETSRYGDAGPLPKGQVMTMTFELDGQQFMALNGGPEFHFTEAISFFVKCETQAEVDFYWNTLTADGGEESQCGWLKDKFGLSWQIVPNVLGRYLADKDPAKANRVMQAMLKMQKIDIAPLEKAYAG